MINLAKQNHIEENIPDSDWYPLIDPLLRGLGWRGNDRHMREAMFSVSLPLDKDKFRDIVAHLGYASQKRVDEPQALQDGMLPAIYVSPEGSPRLLLSQEDIDQLPKIPATLLLFKLSPPPSTAEASASGLQKQLTRFKPVLAQVVFISLLIGVISLVPAYFNMAIYDNIIGSGSTKGLFMLSVGVLIALAAELGMRYIRNRWLAWFGARIDHYVSYSVFERLMFMPPHYTERASVSSQLARLRDFESVREFFTGPLATLFFELPLLLIYIIAMGIMGGWLACVPLALVFAYAGLIAFMNGKIKNSGRLASTTATKRQEFLLESVLRLRAIRLAGLEEAWQARCRQLSAQAADASFRAAFTAQMLETCSYVLMTVGGIATLAFGVYFVISGALTTGALIASMMLVWRIVAPMQICCASITRIQQLGASTRQVQHLLSVAPEHSTYAAPSPIPEVKGHLAFHRVSLRYTPDAEPALLGVAFEIKPGQVVAIRGGNGSGKSSILKILMGMYPPQSGSVRLDGVDIRQLDPLSLRQSISYVPQAVDFFAGSVRDNLLFANPLARDEMLIQALEDACAYDDVMNLPQGIDTKIAGENAEPIPFLLRQRLNLARAYIKPARIMLFDEGSYSLGIQNDVAFAKKIAELRGNSTVVMVTHREDHMRLADTLIVIDKGELTHMGPPDNVLNVLRSRK